MKIIHITDELMPSAGGLVSVPINLAAAQAGLGHDVLLVGRTGSQELFKSGEVQNIPHFKKVRVIDCQHPGLFAKFFPFKAKSILKKEITSNSIVHLHGVWDPLLLLASKIARKTDAEYIVTPHSMLHPWQMKRFVWQKKIVFFIGWRSMFSHAKFIHVLNSAEKQFVEKFNFGAPLQIIPNGIYPEALKAPKLHPFLKKYPHLKTTPYILFLSRLHHQKGIIDLLKGFEVLAQKNSQIHLVLAGPDYGEKETLERQIKNLKSADRILLPGPLYGDEKLDALHHARCFALTSLNEGFSISILEALACERPVVISKECYFPEVETEHAGIITSHEPSAIANALEKICIKTDEAKQMAQNAKQLVESKYTWPIVAKQSIATYEK